MPDAFLGLPQAEQREALEVAAARSGLPLNQLEKDI